MHGSHDFSANRLINQLGMLECCALRHGNVYSADGWREVLDPVIARYASLPPSNASSADFACESAILTQTEQRRLERSVRRTEKLAAGPARARSCGMSRPLLGVSATADTALGGNS